MNRAMNRTGRLGLLTSVLLLFAVVLGSAGPVFGQAIRGEDATEADGAKFQQDRARQHMLELEQRMFKLAEMIKESQPEDAQRLIMGVELSREQLVVQRMASVSDLISGLELNKASDNIDEVIVELQAIRKLLLTADLEQAMKEAQLRKIIQAIKDLEKIEKQEAENKDQSDKLAKEGEPNENATKGVGESEDRNQEATDQLSDKVGDINPKDPSLGKAQEALGKASESMGQASDKLGQGKPGEASKNQDDAKKKLAEAKDELNNAKERLQKEIEQKIREQVMENLRAMLKQQTEIREQLELASDRADRGDARAIVQVRGFAVPEQELILLAQDTIELCDLTEFSVAMPAALSAVRDRMVYLVDDYTAGLGGPTVVNATIRVEEDIKALIEAMELSNANQKPSEPPPGGEPPEDVNKREMNQMLAELRMLRIMQVATNDNVARHEQAEKAGDLASSELRRREEMVRDQQDRVREATAKLREKAMQGG